MQGIGFECEVAMVQYVYSVMSLSTQTKFEKKHTINKTDS